MNFLLLGGQKNTGKTETIRRLTIRLITRYSYRLTIISGSISPMIRTKPGADFSAIIDGFNSSKIQTKILIHSANDNLKTINQLKEEISFHKPDIVICSIRDIHWERNLVLDSVSKHFYFEIPLSRVTRRNTNYINSLNWYRLNIDRVINHIISSSPFNLI